MKYSELVKQLTEIKCRIVRSGREHDIWYSPVTDKKFTVPRHKTKDVPMGTLNSIRKSAGL